MPTPNSPESDARRVTGRDVPLGAWPLSGTSLPFETSLPGVVAAGDVRYRSVKRVAGAVGDGSVTVGSVHLPGRARRRTPGRPVTGQASAATRAPLLAVLSANAVSQVGDMMVAVALPWFVLETTGSVLNMGFTGAVIGIGAMLSSVAGGPLVDRVGLRRASIVSDVTAGAAVAAVPLLYLTDALAFWQFLSLAFLVSLLNSPGDLARRALIPTLARWAAMPLERANAADTAIPRLAQLVGPVLGGVLIAVAGAANVMLLNAATFFLSAALVLVGVPSGASAEADDRGGRDAGGRDDRGGRDAGGRDDHQLFGNNRLIRSHARRYVVDLVQGLRFVLANGLLLSLTVVATVANLLEKPLMSVVAPAYAETYFGSAASFGAMMGAFGAGALAGTLLMGAVGHRLPHRRTFLFCLLVAPLLLFGSLAATPPLPVVLLAAVASGIAFGPLNTLFATAVQEETPPELLGRVIGTITAVSMVSIPVGAILTGVVVEDVGLVATLVGMGVTYVVLAIAMTVNPALRRMDTRQQGLDHRDDS